MLSTQVITKALVSHQLVNGHYQMAEESTVTSSKTIPHIAGAVGVFNLPGAGRDRHYTAWRRWLYFWASEKEYEIDGLVQDCIISSVLAMEILQSCSKQSEWKQQKNTLDKNIHCKLNQIYVHTLQ